MDYGRWKAGGGVISDTGCNTIPFVSNTKSGDGRDAKQVIYARSWVYTVHRVRRLENIHYQYF